MPLDRARMMHCCNLNASRDDNVCLLRLRLPVATMFTLFCALGLLMISVCLFDCWSLSSSCSFNSCSKVFICCTLSDCVDSSFELRIFTTWEPESDFYEGTSPCTSAKSLNVVCVIVFVAATAKRRQRSWRIVIYLVLHSSSVWKSRLTKLLM